jgi:hypothetical protein
VRPCHVTIMGQEETKRKNMLFMEDAICVPNGIEAVPFSRPNLMPL